MWVWGGGGCGELGVGVSMQGVVCNFTHHYMCMTS